jgi:hypothetical protein
MFMVLTLLLLVGFVGENFHFTSGAVELQTELFSVARDEMPRLGVG